nr:uncharacterized protein LOC124815429 [Hydra vulgaris]
MQLNSYLKAIFILISISLCSCLKCYTCTSRSEASCKVTQKFEECGANENTCLTVHHTFLIYSGNKTMVKSRFLKSCAETSRNCKVEYCKRFQECKAYCCHDEGCNESIDPVVTNAKHKSIGNSVIKSAKRTSLGKKFLPYFSLILFLVVFSIFINNIILMQ